MVECHLAKVEVASSNLVSRSWRHSQVVRQRSAKPLFPSSNLGGASKTPCQGGFLIWNGGCAYLSGQAGVEIVSRGVFMIKTAGRSGEMADARDLKSRDSNVVRVQVPPSAPAQNAREGVFFIGAGLEPKRRAHGNRCCAPVCASARVPWHERERRWKRISQVPAFGTSANARERRFLHWRGT